VVVTREPGATDIGARIRGLLLDGSAKPAPRAEALLYAADRAHHVATVVRPALARGAVVISDRYVDSSLAYQGAGRTLPVDEVSWLSAWATGGLKPNLVVLLDVEPAVGLARVTARGNGVDRLEQESLAFHDRVRYAFLDLASADPRRYLVLDAARPVDEIASAVLDRVTDALPAPDDAVVLTGDAAPANAAEPSAGSDGAPAEPDTSAEADEPVTVRLAQVTQLVNGSPGHGSPGHAAPGHAAPGHAAPGHAAPGHAAPGLGLPGQSTVPDAGADSIVDGELERRP